MGEVVSLNRDYFRDPLKVLEEATQVEFDQVMVIGWDSNGDFYLQSSVKNPGDKLLMTCIAEREILDNFYESD